MAELKVGTAALSKPGKANGWLKVGDMPHGRPMEVPVMLVKGKSDGPTLWIQAAIHGNEYTGTYIIHDLIRNIDPKDLKGNIVAIPALNITAYQAGTRGSPFDIYGGSDMNRVFPGKVDGTLTEQMAYHTYKELKRVASAIVDIHTAFMPSTRWSLFTKVDGEAGQRAEAMARAFGYPVILPSKTAVLSSSCYMCAAREGIPGLIIEAGGKGPGFTPEVVTDAAARMRNVARALGMLDEKVEKPKNKSVFITEFAWIRSTRNLRSTVEAGVTTIRTVSDIGHLDVAARDAVRDGLCIGPRIVPCGKGLSSTGGHGQKLPCWICQSHGEVVEIVDGAEAITSAVRRQARAGAEWIKVFQTGGVVDKHGRIDAEEFLPEEFTAAIEAAKLLGMPVAVHAHNRPAILRSIRAGARSVEHGMDFDEECARVAAEHGTFLVPTLTVMDNIVRMGKTAGVADYVIDNVRKRTEQHVKYVRYAHEVGVPIAAGTDAGSILTPHGSAGSEVANLGRIGFSPLDAIRTATETAARLLRIDDKLGTLTKGKLADVIVVKGDVMSNLALLEDRANVRRVMIGGQTIVEKAA